MDADARKRSCVGEGGMDGGRHEGAQFRTTQCSGTMYSLNTAARSSTLFSTTCDGNEVTCDRPFRGSDAIGLDRLDIRRVGSFIAVFSILADLVEVKVKKRT